MGISRQRVTTIEALARVTDDTAYRYIEALRRLTERRRIPGVRLAEEVDVPASRLSRLYDALLRIVRKAAGHRRVG